MRDWRSVGTSCFMASTLGGLVSLAVCKQFHWAFWIICPGAILAGVAAYIIEDAAHFAQGIGFAYKASIAWRPNYLFWKILPKVSFWLLWGFTGILTYTLMFMILVFSLFIFLTRKAPNAEITIGTCLESLCLGLFLVTSIFFFLVFIPIARKILRHPQTIESEIRELREAARQDNAIQALRHLWKKSVQGVISYVHGFEHGMILVCDCISMLFVYVHSEKRLICFVDTFLATFIGFCLGWRHHDVLLGTLVSGALGPFLGILNYEIVSKRFLKKVPE